MAELAQWNPRRYEMASHMPAVAYTGLLRPWL